MINLQLKAPPLLLLISFGIASWLLAISTPELSYQPPFHYGLLGLFGFIGIVFVASGVISFRIAQTTVNPTKPETSSTLVTSGVYRISRNPMYVGFLIILLGLGIFWGNPLCLLLAVGFYFYLNKFQIIPEEKMLKHLFKTEYTEYQQQVRRWL